MNIKNILALTTLTLLSTTALASGSHEAKHDEKPECTEEHAAMGHCEMDEMKHHASKVGMRADASKATETVKVNALDTMRFEFDREFDISPGKTITFEVTNTGTLRHEFSIGNHSDQISHAETMMKNPGMMHGDGDAAISLEAGETKSLTWTFEGNEEIVFACTLPGHYQAGMLHKQKVLNKQ